LYVLGTPQHVQVRRISALNRDSSHYIWY
jgi:hypothetical protein